MAFSRWQVFGVLAETNLKWLPINKGCKLKPCPLAGAIFSGSCRAIQKQQSLAKIVAIYSNG